MITTLLLAAASTFNSWYSPDIAQSCLDYAAREEYCQCLDYNGDGILSVVDSIAINRKYNENLTNGNIYIFNSDDVLAVVEENLNYNEYNEYFYYEIDFVNNSPCRLYEVAAGETTKAHVYCETNENSFQFTVEIDPVCELVKIID